MNATRVSSPAVHTDMVSGIQTVSWADKVAGGSPASSRIHLQYFSPVVANNRIIVSPPEEVASLGEARWKDCVVGYFVGKKLSFNSITDKIRGKYGLIDVLSNEEGFYFFQFDKTGAYREVLEAGPWHGGRLIMLKQWQPQNMLQKDPKYVYRKTSHRKFPFGPNSIMFLWNFGQMRD